MKKAVLFIHGFAALPEDNVYFIEEMKKHSLIDIHTFILPGHEQPKMGKVKYQDWIEACEREINQVLEKYSKVTVVAHSMGCVLAIDLAAKYKQIEKLVLISPAHLYGNKEQIKSDLKNIMTKKIDSKLGTGFEGVFTKIRNVSFFRFLEYRKLVKKTEMNTKKVSCPTLILHGTKDTIVPIRSSLMVFNQLQGKKHLTLIENVRHQVFKSHKKAEITKYIYQYIIGGIVFHKKDMI